MLAAAPIHASLLGERPVEMILLLGAMIYWMFRVLARKRVPRNELTLSPRRPDEMIEKVA